MYLLTVYIAGPGTPTLGPPYGDPSVAGHMWYTISHGGCVKSYGFSPAGRYSGRAVAWGAVNAHKKDTEYYLGYSLKEEIDITREQYEALQKFGEAPHLFGFDMFYNGLTNSCIDFVWKALEVGGLNKTGFEGVLLPSGNADYIKYNFKKERFRRAQQERKNQPAVGALLHEPGNLGNTAGTQVANHHAAWMIPSPATLAKVRAFRDAGDVSGGWRAIADETGDKYAKAAANVTSQSLLAEITKAFWEEMLPGSTQYWDLVAANQLTNYVNSLERGHLPNSEEIERMYVSSLTSAGLSRNLSIDLALNVLMADRPDRQWFHGIGLESHRWVRNSRNKSDLDNQKLAEIMARATAMGLVAHAVGGFKGVTLDEDMARNYLFYEDLLKELKIPPKDVWEYGANELWLPGIDHLDVGGRPVDTRGLERSIPRHSALERAMAHLDGGQISAGWQVTAEDTGDHYVAAAAEVASNNPLLGAVTVPNSEETERPSFAALAAEGLSKNPSFDIGDNITTSKGFDLHLFRGIRLERDRWVSDTNNLRGLEQDGAEDAPQQATLMRAGDCPDVMNVVKSADNYGELGLQLFFMEPTALEPTLRSEDFSPRSPRPLQPTLRLEGHIPGAGGDYASAVDKPARAEAAPASPFGSTGRSVADMGASMGEPACYGGAVASAAVDLEMLLRSLAKEDGPVAAPHPQPIIMQTLRSVACSPELMDACAERAVDRCLAQRAVDQHGALHD